jgi:transcriptional regulator with XRE-family HTH domain
MRLRTWREKRGLTQVQLAEKAQLSQEYIARLEGGSKANPSLEVLVKLAKALKVTVGELVG